MLLTFCKKLLSLVTLSLFTLFLTTTPVIIPCLFLISFGLTVFRFETNSSLLLSLFIFGENICRFQSKGKGKISQIKKKINNFINKINKISNQLTYQ